jgi:putative PIN family toxin of toxin-antitoxin system
VTRAVVDTNLLLRMAAGAYHLPLYVAWREKRFTLVLSAEMLSELQGVMMRPKVRHFLPPMRGQGFCTLLRDLALFVSPAGEFPPCRDPGDDIVVATAVAARPCYLVTADRDLYDDADLVAALRELEVHVVRASEFLVAL